MAHPAILVRKPTIMSGLLRFPASQARNVRVSRKLCLAILTIGRSGIVWTLSFRLLHRLLAFALRQALQWHRYANLPAGGV
jgi:hypothetical protein